MLTYASMRARCRTSAQLIETLTSCSKEVLIFPSSAVLPLRAAFAAWVVLTTYFQSDAIRWNASQGFHKVGCLYHTAPARGGPLNLPSDLKNIHHIFRFLTLLDIGGEPRPKQLLRPGGLQLLYLMELLTTFLSVIRND